MISESQAGTRSAANSFTAADVAAILRERGWLREEDESISRWLADAAALLGPHAADHGALADLLALVFEYDARAVLAARTSQEVLARTGAREVLRALASEILSGGAVDSDRLKEIINALKDRTPYRSRGILLPLRVAVAGRAGGGELDRVILLLDRAAQAEGLAPVKSVRARILEFCSALD
jgi:anticodon-binding protein